MPGHSPKTHKEMLPNWKNDVTVVAVASGVLEHLEAAGVVEMELEGSKEVVGTLLNAHSDQGVYAISEDCDGHHQT
eukprot:2698878-Rhodomonas_salina.1